MVKYSNRKGIKNRKRVSIKSLLSVKFMCIFICCDNKLELYNKTRRKLRFMSFESITSF